MVGSPCGGGESQRDGGGPHGGLGGDESGDGVACEGLVGLEDKAKRHRRQPDQRGDEEPDRRGWVPDGEPGVHGGQGEGGDRERGDQIALGEIGWEGGAVDEAREQDQRQEDLADPAHPLGDMVRVLPMQRPRPTEEDERDEQLHIGLHVVGNVGKREQQKAENPDEGQ